jgi:protein-disulfide isomerase
MMSGDLQMRVRKLHWVLLTILILGGIVAWFAIDRGFWSHRESDLAAELPQAEFERRVRDYLMEHPEVIMEMANRLEARQRAEDEAARGKILQDHAEQIFRDPDSPVGGNPEGDVTLVEFFDYNCPYCRQMAPLMVQAETADSRLRIVYKEFPILGPSSVFAAKAALAARKQAKYAEFHKALMQVRGPADGIRTLAVASKIGLDTEQLKSDMQDAAIQALIDRNIALAQALHIDGTPGFVVGDRIFTGAADLKSLQTTIEQARNKH